MAPYEALYGRQCRSPIYWDEVGERKILGLELVQITIENIRLICDMLLTTQSRQKNYANKRRHELEFEEGDHIFLKVSLTKGVMRFGKKSKLSPRFIRPFEILKRVGDLAYELALSPNLSHVHHIFHVSMLQKYIHDLFHVLENEPFQVCEDLSYEKQPVMLLDRKEQVL